MTYPISGCPTTNRWKHTAGIIEQALQDADGNQTKAAERLRLQRTYLARLLRQQRQKLSDKGDEADEEVTAQAGYPRVKRKDRFQGY